MRVNVTKMCFFQHEDLINLLVLDQNTNIVPIAR